MASVDLPRRRIVENQLNERILLKRYEENELHVLKQDIAIATNYLDVEVTPTFREPEDGIDPEMIAVLKSHHNGYVEVDFDITIYYLLDSSNRYVIVEIAVDYA